MATGKTCPNSPRLFLGTPKGRTRTPVVIRIVADGEQKPASGIPAGILSFAAKFAPECSFYPVQQRARLNWMLRKLGRQPCLNLQTPDSQSRELRGGVVKATTNQRQSKIHDPGSRKEEQRKLRERIQQTQPGIGAALVGYCDRYRLAYQRRVQLPLLVQSTGKPVLRIHHRCEADQSSRSQGDPEGSEIVRQQRKDAAPPCG